MLEYCTAPLNPAAHPDLVAACIQAKAALVGASEQAAAGRFQGWMTIAAGFSALLAGAAAYLAARRQVQLNERQHEWARQAYVHFLRHEANWVQTEITQSLRLLRVVPSYYLRTFAIKPPLARTREFLDLISPRNWNELVRAEDLLDDIEIVALQLSQLVHHWDSFIREQIELEPDVGELKNSIEQYIQDIVASTERSSKALTHFSTRTQAPPAPGTAKFCAVIKDRLAKRWRRSR